MQGNRGLLHDLGRAGADTDPTHEETIQTLRDRARGSVLLPDDDGYSGAREIWNGMVEKRPALIARCTGTADVIAAVDFAREHDLPLSIKGGGHNAAGKALCDDGLTIDCSPTRSVRVDPESRTARVGAGARLGDLDHESQAFGLATPAGVDSRTGVAGLTLGGGIGWLSRSFGLSCDNLRSSDVVTADGEMVRASEDEHPDLFWALRGGGGNFGVVTSFEFQLHEVGPEVFTAQAYHPLEDARDVFRFYREYMADAPVEVGCYGFIVRVPPVEPFPEEHHGETAAALVACYSGSVEEGHQALEPIRTHGDPILAFGDPMPYTALQQTFDDGFPNGERYYGKSTFIEELSDEVIDVLLSHVDPMLGPMSAFFFESMGGAINRVPTGATAFPHLDAAFNLSVTTGWSDPAKDKKIIDWARSFHDDLAPHSTGGVCANYLDQDDDGRVDAAFMENHERLVQVKTRWDPENLFRHNQNVQPEA